MEEAVPEQECAAPAVTNPIALHLQPSFPVKPKRKSTTITRHSTLFRDVETAKAEVRQALVRERYDVKDMYKLDGCAQRLARSHHFETLTLGVVAFNAIWIAVDADMNNAAVLSKSEMIFQVAEHGFCLYFLFEWFIRLCAFRKTLDAFSDAWFAFDTVLVTSMVVETWLINFVVAIAIGGQDGTQNPNVTVLKLMRMARLTRMARMAKLLRWMPELMVLLKGLGLASRNVFFTLVLLAIVIYVFGLTFRQLTDGMDIGDEYFPSVLGACSTLLLRGALPDFAELVTGVGTEHWAFGLLLFVFILMASLTVLNMLVGVLVEVVANVSTMENDKVLSNFVRAKMQEMIEKIGIDRDGNNKMSRSEFEILLIRPEAAQFMEDVGVDVVGLLESADVIFKAGDLSFCDFVELLLMLRGSNCCKVRDVVDLRKWLMIEFDELHNKLLAVTPPRATSEASSLKSVVPQL